MPSYQARALALLRQALERVPPAERIAFWRDYVQADSALAAIRHSQTMTELAARLVRSSR
jgi:hypothetical protein